MLQAEISQKAQSSQENELVPIRMGRKFAPLFDDSDTNACAS
jgi:hypothetical protein